MNKKIKKAKAENNFVVFRSHCKKTPSWSDVVELLYNSVKSQKQMIPEDVRNLSGTTFIYHKLDPVIYGAFDFPDTGIYKKFLKNEKKLRKLMGLNLLDANPKVIANMIGSEVRGYGIHPDDHDVVLWQCEGTVEWRIYKNFPESEIYSFTSSHEYESVILNPGDLIFCPSGLVHQVVVSGPRASLIFGFNVVV